MVSIVIVFNLSTQSAKDMGPTRALYWIQMGPIWAPRMGLRWDLQHGFMWYPQGQTYMGHTWEPYGSYSGFGLSGPCSANLCGIVV